MQLEISLSTLEKSAISTALKMNRKVDFAVEKSKPRKGFKEGRGCGWMGGQKG